MEISYREIERLQMKARRERSREVYCLIQRAILRLRARLPGADPSLRDANCCAA